MSGLFGDDTLTLYLKLKEAMKQYVRDAMPGGALNPEVKPQDTLDAAALSLSPVPLVGDAAGLLADGYRYATDPSSRTPLNYGLSALGALPFVPSMAGQIAWHGSPYKFDKFDLSKIGTGEGAQAYGHGLYLAESPEVARDYQKVLSGPRNQIAKGQGKYFHITDAGSGEVTIAGYGSSQDQWGRSSNLSDFWDGSDEGFKSVDDAVAWLRNNKHIDETATPNKVSNAEFNEWQIPSSGGSLYKTDIPDEAVARFLDWDKPLSQQAKEVQAALGKYVDTDKVKILDLIRKGEQPDGFGVVKSGNGYAPIIGGEVVGNGAKDLVFRSQDEAISYIANRIPATDPTAASIYRRMVGDHGGSDGISQAQVSGLLRQQGIPGIRYLDGGSRGAGTGTSNYVVFDPEMIRILERNGEATGAKPWQPGEWEGLFKK